jgi:hypothetical protein
MNCAAMTCILEKIDQLQRGRVGTENLTRLSKQALDLLCIVHYFKINKQNLLCLLFSVSSQPKNFNQLRLYRKYWYNLVGFQEIDISWPSPFKVTQGVYVYLGNSALVYEPKCGRGGGELGGLVSANEYSCVCTDWSSKTLGT